METAKLSKELAPVKVQIAKVERAANAIKIKTADDMLIATELLGMIKTVGKEVRLKKESVTKPFNEALRNFRAIISPLEKKWFDAERIVKQKMIYYQNEQIAKAEKETEKIEEKVEKGKMTFDKAAEKIESVTPEKNVVADSGSVQFRTIKEVVIDNEKLVPREYLVLDMVKIRKVALAGVNIAGVRVIEKQTVAGLTK